MSADIVQLGKGISNVGTPRFFSAMQRLIIGIAVIDVMHVSIWNTNVHRSCFVDGVPIHGTELLNVRIRNRLPEPVIAQILDPDGPELIYVEPQRDATSDSLPPAHHFLVLMRRFESHFVIFLQRNVDRGEFHPDELASFGEVSLALLPLVERHASLQQFAPVNETTALAINEAAWPESSVETLSQRFQKRLERQNITLSSREQQVCILILSGYTSPAICEELHLKTI